MQTLAILLTDPSCTTDTSQFVSGNDLWITVGTIMFTLSMISERLIELIKSFLSVPELKESGLRDEQKWKRKILWWAIPSGIVVAFLAGADLFTLLKDGKLLSFSDLFCCGYRIIGAILTGFFISLGSKFWHDLLEIIRALAKLRRPKPVIQDQSKANNNPS